MIREPTAARNNKFLSTLSLRRATQKHINSRTNHIISIHALLAESDNQGKIDKKSRSISIHALLAESDALRTGLTCGGGQFLSTLSLRRATTQFSQKGRANRISIHALLAESDISVNKVPNQGKIFLSTLSLRRATIRHRIHLQFPHHFYPRSPCGERL